MPFASRPPAPRRSDEVLALGPTTTSLTNASTESYGNSPPPSFVFGSMAVIENSPDSNVVPEPFDGAGTRSVGLSIE